MKALSLRSTFGKSAVRSSGEGQREADFIRQVIRDNYFRDRNDRRKHIRYPIALTVDVTALDGRGEPCGQEFTAVTRDISSGGAYLYTTQPFTADKAQLTLQNKLGETCPVVLRVLHRGSVGPLHYMAGEFELGAAGAQEHWMELVTA